VRRADMIAFQIAEVTKKDDLITFLYDRKRRLVTSSLLAVKAMVLILSL
jgi:hypothetical protein